MSQILTNGKLTRIDVRQPAAADGSVTWSTGSTIDVAVAICDPSRAQRWAMGTQIAEAQQVIYILRSDLAAGTDIQVGDWLVANFDGQASATWEVIKVLAPVFRELSHFECFVKPA